MLLAKKHLNNTQVVLYGKCKLLVVSEIRYLLILGEFATVILIG